MPAVKRQTVLAGATIMSAAALLSRLLGWVRDRAIGHYWGAGGHSDAYWAAFTVPDLLYYLLAGGALSAAVIPVFTAYLQRKDDDESWRAANTLVTLLVVCALTGVVFIELFAPSLVRLTVPGLMSSRGPDAVAETAGYVRLLAPMLLFTVLSALFTGLIQSHRHFTAPALSWLVYNLGVIAGAFIGGSLVARHAGQVAGLRTLCLGVVTGAMLQVLVQLPPLLARGFRYRPMLDLRHPGVREVLHLFFPYMAGLAFTQICLLWLPSFFGSYFEAGAITSLRYANRLVVLPLGVFSIAISTAAFPKMAEQVAAGEMARFRGLISGSMRAVLFLAVPSVAALIVLAGPIIRLLWRSGRFDEQAVRAAEFCLLFYAFSLIGISALQVLNRACYSLRDRRTPPLVGAGYTVVIVGVAIVLMSGRLQYAAIAASTSVGVTVGALVMFEVLRRRLGGIAGWVIVGSFARMVVAAAAAGFAAWQTSHWLGGRLGVPDTHFWLSPPPAGAPVPAPVLFVAGQVASSLLVGAAVYLACLWVMRAPELGSAGEMLRRRMSRTREMPSAG